MKKKFVVTGFDGGLFGSMILILELMLPIVLAVLTLVVFLVIYQANSAEKWIESNFGTIMLKFIQFNIPISLIISIVCSIKTKSYEKIHIQKK